MAIFAIIHALYVHIRTHGQKGRDRQNTIVQWQGLFGDYISYADTRTTRRFDFNPTDTQGGVIDTCRIVRQAFRFIQNRIRRLAKSSGLQGEFPPIVSATQETDFAMGIWGRALPEEVKTYVAEESDETFDRFCYLLRLIVLARYVNNCVAITVVTASNEDDAFDMFEALNTTGEPLTAFETFKPKVIELESISRYEHSPSYVAITDIESYLNRFTKADEKQRATSEMLVPFRVGGDWTKASKEIERPETIFEGRIRQTVCTQRQRQKPGIRAINRGSSEVYEPRVGSGTGH